MAHRRDVNGVMGPLLTILLALWPEAGGGTGQPCEVIPVPCTFEGAAFTLTIVDARTRQRLADVHALAEWQMYGAGGRRNGPLMVQDTLSGVDGVVAFPPWGPVRGSALGLVIGYDPVITLFKPGYKALLVNNGYLPPAREREAVRRFVPSGSVYELEPFQSPIEQWLDELQKVSNPVAAPISDDLLRRFRTPYLNRLRTVDAELRRLPEPLQSTGRRRMLIDRDLLLLDEGLP